MLSCTHQTLKKKQRAIVNLTKPKIHLAIEMNTICYKSLLFEIFNIWFLIGEDFIMGKNDNIFIFFLYEQRGVSFLLYGRKITVL